MNQRPKLLVLSRKQVLPWGLPQELQPEAELHPITSWSDLSQHLSQRQAPVVIIDHEADPQLEVLDQVADQFPDVLRVLWTSDRSTETFIHAINRGRVLRISDFSADGAEKTLREVWEEVRSEAERIALVRRSARHNRELEELTASLETRVEERTRGILQAQEQEEEKLHLIRKLVKFVKDLTGTTSAEEIFHVLRSDLRSFHQVMGPLLLLPTNGHQGTHSFLYAQKSQTLRQAWPGSPPNNGVPLAEMTKILGRPLAKLIAIELRLRRGKGFLWIEHSCTAKEQKALEAHLYERIRPLEAAVDRLLLESENIEWSFRWERTFDSLRNGVCIVSRDFQILRSNQRFSSKFRKGPCFEVFAGRKSVCEGCPVESVWRDGRPHQGTVHTSSGIYQVESFPIQWSPDGPPGNVVSFYNEISHQRELQKKVLHAEKMGAIGLLAGNVAHELNNPLTGLRSLSQVLQAQIKGSQHSHRDQLLSDLSEVEKAAERCQKIIQNLQEFTKVSEPSAALQPLVFDDLIERTLPFVKSLLRNHRYHINLRTRPHRVLVEPQLLQQVVFNLINNACQAMKDSGELTVETRRTEDGDLELLVQDTGLGIPLELQSKVFEPFFTTKAPGQGTGIGLSLSREIVEKFGGVISFTSQPGTGTTFSVRLPSAETP